MECSCFFTQTIYLCIFVISYWQTVGATVHLSYSSLLLMNRTCFPGVQWWWMCLTMQKAEFGAPQEFSCLPPKSTFSCCVVGSKKEKNYLHESKCSLKQENKRVGKRHFYLLKYHCFELIPELMLCKFFQLDIICEKNMSWIRCILWRQYRVCLFLEQRYPASSIVPSVLQPSRTYRPYLRSWALCAEKKRQTMQVPKDLQKYIKKKILKTGMQSTKSFSGGCLQGRSTGMELQAPSPCAGWTASRPRCLLKNCPLNSSESERSVHIY